METLLQHGDANGSIPEPIPTARLTIPGGESRYHRIRQWTSDYLPTPRDLFVWLPEAYAAQPLRRFPVLLLHDGQNLFDGDLNLAIFPHFGLRPCLAAH